MNGQHERKVFINKGKNGRCLSTTAGKPQGNKEWMRSSLAADEI
jgi:hypothetical protein